MPYSGYPTPDAQDGDVTFGCIPVVVPNNPEFNQLFAAAIYGLYASMSKPHFWRAFGTLTPELAAEYASRGLAQTEAYEECGDDCSDELLPTHSIITYEPQDPHTEPDLVPDGYLLPPFWVFGDALPEFITDWFGGLIEELTGYNLTDIMVTIGSFPILAGWDELITSSLPRIEIATTGAGTLELHLLAVPFGGRVLITLDEIPTTADIVLGLYNDSDYMVDTVLDITSIPPETVEEVIIEYTTDIDTAHIFYATFIPVVDDELIPLAFGGGLRSVVWCGYQMPDCPECPECPEPEECTIEELLADEEFFTDEYVPATFGTTYTNTADHIADLETAYDTTPQSIGENIPTGTPNDPEKFALCAAIKGFIQMYAAQKIAMIQSRNFVEIAWDKVVFAATQAFDSAVDLLLGLFGADYGDCAVDSEEAITALSDDTAIEELQCELLDLLDGAAITETLFNDSIDALTLLTGNAQIIACMMSNDNNLQIYLMFLEIYNSKLIQQDMGTELDCECISASYRVKTYDFSLGLNGWRISYVINTSTAFGVLESDGVNSVQSSANVEGIVMLLDGHDPDWRVHGYRVEFSRDGAGGTGTDLGRLFFRPNPDSTLSQANLNPGGGNAAGSHIFSCAVLAPSTNYGTGYRQISTNFQCNSPGSEKIKIHKIEIWYMDGFAPAGCYATTDDNPCA